MMRRTSFVLIWVGWAVSAAADETRTVTDANGQTWNEVHRTIRHPQTQTQCVDQPQTYYQESCNVQMCDSYRTYRTPVTEYVWESHWVGRFNPFVQPYLTQRLVPRTRWETRTEVVQVPVVQRSVVPVTRTVRVPVTTETMVDHDVVVHRQLVSPTQAIASGPAANQQAISVGGQKNFNPRPHTVNSSSSSAAPSTLMPGPDTEFARAPTNPAQISKQN